MARENQGLQIAIIIFVFLSVVLGTTTWYFYQKSTELAEKVKTETAAKDKAQQEQSIAETASSDFAKLISGPSASGKFDDARKQADEIMKEYSATLKQDEQNYVALVKKLGVIRIDNEKQLKEKNDSITKVEDKYKVRESSKDSQIKDFREAADKAGQELVAAKTDFDKRRSDAEKLLTDNQTKLASVRKDATTESEKLKEDIKNLEKNVTVLKTSLGEKSTQINEMKRTIVDNPDGDIRWVNQRSGLVWINVGRADGLQPLMTFSVFPADVSDLSKGARKGSIEVTQILGDHMAEARITEDSITDPLMPGDKIDTALWNPGEQLHFALAGFMDVNGDNRDDLETVKNLITMNNGVVDAWEDDKGRVHGLDSMSINTRFLVKGGEGRKEANVATLAGGVTKMQDQAEKLGVQIITLQSLLQRMGYHAAVSTRASGEETPPLKPAQPKPGSTESRTKSNELFQPRHPVNSGTP
jgi:hypothetical protein